MQAILPNSPSRPFHTTQQTSTAQKYKTPSHSYYYHHHQHHQQQRQGGGIQFVREPKGKRSV